MKHMLTVGETPFEIELHASHNEARINGKLYRCEAIRHKIILNDKEFDCDPVRDPSGKLIGILVQGKYVAISSQRQTSASSKTHIAEVRAPLNGQVVKIKMESGHQVKAGDCILTLEAMKMENELIAPANGVLKELHVAEKEIVKAGQLLFRIE